MSLSSKLDAKYCSSALCFWVSNPFQNTLSLVEYGDMNDLDCTELIFINNVTVFFFNDKWYFFLRDTKRSFFFPNLIIVYVFYVCDELTVMISIYYLNMIINARNVLFEKFQEKMYLIILHLNNKQD